MQVKYLLFIKYRTAFNLTSMMAGVVMFAIPHAFEKTGVLLGIILLVSIGVVMRYTSVLLIETANTQSVRSYEELIRKVLGKPGFVFLCVLAVFLNIGACIVFVKVINGCIAPEITFFNDKIVTVSLCLIISGPLCFVGNLESFSMISQFKTFVISIVVLFIIIRGATDTYHKNENYPDFESFSTFAGSTKAWINKDSWFDSIGTFFFAMVSQDAIFPLHRSMKDQSTSAFQKMISIAMVMTAIMLVVTGGSSVLIFQARLPQNILDARDEERVFSNDVWFGICRYLAAVTLSLTLPLLIGVAREYFVSIYDVFNENSSQSENNVTQSSSNSHTIEPNCHKQIQIPNDEPDLKTDPNLETETTSSTKHNCEFLQLFKMRVIEYIGATFSLTVTLLAPFLLSEGINDILGMLGDFGVSILAMILPPILHFCTHEGGVFGLLKEILSQNQTKGPIRPLFSKIFLPSFVLLLGIATWCHSIYKHFSQ